MTHIQASMEQKAAAKQEVEKLSRTCMKDA